MSMVVGFVRVTTRELEDAESDPDRADEILRAALERREREDSPDGYLDKTWDGLDFLFDAAGVAVALHDEVDSISDSLFAWYAEDVAATAQALRGVSFDELRRHYDAAVMNSRGVYPSSWGDDDGEWLREYFESLVAFFDDTARRGDAALKEFG